MPYDTGLATRIDDLTADWGLTTKKMFGGICCLLNGNMAFGVYKDFLIVRAGEAAAAEALKRPDVRVFDITGRPMKGWLMVAPSGYEEDAALLAWLEMGRVFAATLPGK